MDIKYIVKGHDPKGNPYYKECVSRAQMERRITDLRSKGYTVNPYPPDKVTKEAPNEGLIEAEGVLRYHRGKTGGFKLELVICKGIGMFYRSLIPKWHNVRGQRYEQHISVVRKEKPRDMSKWGIHEGRKVKFYYDPRDIQNDDTYWWINCWSRELEDIRIELGLPVGRYSDTKPRKGFRSTFHTTLGNTKNLDE